MPPDPPAKGDSPAPFASHTPHRSMVHRSMGGDCTRARSYDHLCGSLAPTPTSFGASTPTYSPHHHINMGGGNSQVSPYHQRGSTMPSAVSPAPLARAALSRRLDGWMAPSPISYGASMPSYSPCHSISSTSMKGEYFPMARPNMPSVEVTRSGHPAAIVEWAACASAATVSASVNDVLKYWMTYVHPHEKALFQQQTCDLYCNISGSPLYPDREMQARRARWVCTYLAMSVSPSHPHHHMGGSPGPHPPIILGG